LIVNTDRASMKKIRKEQEKNYAELSARINREKKVNVVLGKMEVQKQIMGKGRKKKVKDETDDSPAVYKWFHQRKK
jgi:U3 small nucleolar RNA-associated protein 11